jgi:hypothetical protein
MKIQSKPNQKMKNTKSLNPEKKFESLFSMLSKNNLLDLNQMVCVRGGDGTPDPIILPPNPPKKEQ